ncbi:MAG: alpha/beta fold hydrolase [Pseudomonadota bacterium]
MPTRRQLIASIAGTGALINAPQASITSKERITFVLVHGTWHGGWVWRDVRNLLTDLGHRVFTPTCTGCGEREHLGSPEVGLATHIEDVARVIEFEELDNVVLVGHSFAGMTITGVADQYRDRIRRIVFFDAVVPREGRMSGLEKDPETGALPAWWRAREKKFIDGYKMKLWDEYPVEMLLPATMTSHVARLKRLITTHPAKQWTDDLTLKNGGWADLRRAYVHCVGQAYSMTSEKMIGPARDDGWEFVALDAPRNAMMTHPQLTAQTLLDLA